ncbi:MAG: GNAT family N-acetyltransferase [Verrucomicrobiales bacterium]|nr:GNAT family N-acetyltransferase [Verrucomicrobiales bacterium]
MFTVRTLKPRDFDAVAELIYLSTNSWYQKNRGYEIFEGGPEVCRLFCDVYEELDPGCAMVAEHNTRKTIIGSCFVHPRETHISIGIMNVHPSYFGDGVAGALMDSAIAFAKQEGQPIRLVSSAMNLESFSLYTRKGFVPFATYQDVMFDVPLAGIPEPDLIKGIEVREADPHDLMAMGHLEFEVSGISREQDYCYFEENASGVWQTLVAPDQDGEIDGFLVSIDHPGSRMIGPGVARTPEVAAALVHRQLDRFRGKKVVCLSPVDQPVLVNALYGMGGRNVEIHLGQVLGEAQPVDGVVMPSFMPETG